MSTFHEILAPVDFSEGARAATRVAADLSRRFEAPLTLAYVFEPTVYPLPDEYVLFTSEQLDHMFAEFNAARLTLASPMVEPFGASASGPDLSLDGGSPRQTHPGVSAAIRLLDGPEHIRLPSADACREPKDCAPS
jgi:nucleotide-binding universal stress UspA family protein